MGKKINAQGAASQHPGNFRTELEKIAMRWFIRKHRIQTLGVFLTLSFPLDFEGNFVINWWCWGEALELQYSELTPSKS